MNVRKNIDLGQLKVWSDNPRYGSLSNDNSKMTEQEAINLLIDVVGEKKMLNLALDIIESKGLNANVIPTVVEKDSSYYVFDGNRRISSIKMIKNTNIIEDKYALLINGIKTKTEGLDLSFLDTVFVYVTTEDEALRLMDKTHTGEQDGVGVLPWDAFNRDISLNRRGKNPKYPISFKVASILNWSRKKDFVIPYTDFQRLFSSRALLNAFNIIELSISYKEQLASAVSALVSYKGERGFNSFSRQFNITETDSETDSTKPINVFINWWKLKQNTESLYFIRIDPQITFTDLDFNFDFSKIHVIHRESQKEISDLAIENLEIQFYDPLGKRKKDFNQKIGGAWLVKVFYKGVVGNGLISNKTAADNPDVRFNDNLSRINKGESLNIDSYIRYAKSVHGNDMKLLSILSVGDKDAVINGQIFSSDNGVGEYVLSFKFDNDGEEYSINKTLVVLPNTRAPINRTEELPFSFNVEFSISFSNDVMKLIEEINDLWKTGKFRHVICCSGRSVAELCLDYIESKDSTIFSNSKDLETRIIELCDYLQLNRSKISDISVALNLKFHNLNNQIAQLRSNASDLASALHLGAHKSASVLDSENLFNKMHIYVCLLIQLAEGFKLI